MRKTKKNVKSTSKNHMKLRRSRRKTPKKKN